MRNGRCMYHLVSASCCLTAWGGMNYSLLRVSFSFNSMLSSASKAQGLLPPLCIYHSWQQHAILQLALLGAFLPRIPIGQPMCAWCLLCAFYTREEHRIR